MPLPIFLLPLAVYAGRAIYKKLQESGNPPNKSELSDWEPKKLSREESRRLSWRTYSSVHRYRIPKKEICLIGRTGSGKSSTANALIKENKFVVGAEHGSTTQISRHVFNDGYFIVDTPGLLDPVNYEDPIINQIFKSKVIVFVTSGQLYREELDFIETMAGYLEKTGDRQQSLALFVNQQDIKESTVTSLEREIEKKAIIEQVAKWIPPHMIAFGAASPKKFGVETVPVIDDVKKLIEGLM